MNMVDFVNGFSEESACEEHLIQLRWKEGFRCPKCTHTEAMLVHAKHRRNASKRMPLFECKNCHRQTSVTSGTIFHKSQTPLNKWFLAIYLVSNDKRGIAATTLSGDLGVSYPTAWLMLKKIRKAMGERNSLYQIGGTVQVDEFYLGGESHGDGRRGRGTDQDSVVIGVSLKKGAPVHCFMELVSDTSKRTMLDVFSRRLKSDVILETDGNPTYAACATEIDVSHLVTLSTDENAHEVFRWVNTIVSNLKKFVDGTYHGREQHKQSYLEEFTYRFNRRRAGDKLVEQLLKTCALAKPLYYTAKT